MDKTFLHISVTTPYFYPGEAEAVIARLRGGDDYVHIRKPGASAAEVSALVSAIPADLRSRLTLHDGTDAASTLGVGGIHLGSRCPSVPAGWQGRVSISCHSISECRAIRDGSPSLGERRPDYVTLSPIFPSISKPGYHADFAAEDLRSLLAETNRVPVVALGGVTTSRKAILRDLGFDGMAMLGDAWRTPVDRDKFSLQFITNPADADDAVRQTRQVLEGGCRWVQLRWKEASDRDVLGAARRIAPLCRDAGAVFLLDDRVPLVRDAQADGVHLGRNDMPVADARRILGPAAIIGATANVPEDIFAAAAAGADYVGYGPFRFTTTKKNLSPILGLEGYRRAIAACRSHSIDIPVVAIGGITAADIPGIMATGVNGIAVSGTLLHADDIPAGTRRLLGAIHAGRGAYIS